MAEWTPERHKDARRRRGWVKLDKDNGPYAYYARIERSDSLDERERYRRPARYARVEV